MNYKTQVLIAGAGPTGLMMACQLRKFDIDCIIFDEKNNITTESRALVVQARSLQIYNQMGLMDTIKQEGQPVKKVKFIINAKLKQELNFENIGKDLSEYGLLYVFEQSKNEKVLYEHFKNLGGEVKWKNTLIDFIDTNTGVQATIKDEEGNETKIFANYLVAADGAKSFIRHTLQMPFTGGTYEDAFIVADTAAAWPWGHECLSLCLTGKTFGALFPMKGDDRFRLIGTLPTLFHAKEIKSFNEIKSVVEEEMKSPVPFTHTNWFSVYKIHHRCVNNFRRNNIFLAGDAAHVHSPVGGQGMNTGLQDAYNLAWKLALVLQNKADEKLLSSYNEERLPVAKRLVKTTDKAFSFITSEKKILKFFRLNILPVFIKYVLHITIFRVFIFRNLSQIAINYRTSLLSYNASRHLLKAGNLVPFTNINSQKLEDVLKFNGFTFLLFNCRRNEDGKKMLSKTFLVGMQFISVDKNETNKDAFKKFKVRKSGVFVIRPDNYIGFTSDKFDTNELKNYFTERLFLTSNH